MKCPYCGAETNGNVCSHCGSELPENKTQSSSNTNYGGTAVVCPNCGSNKMKFKREKIGSYKQASGFHGKGYSSGTTQRNYAYRTVAVCQNCGATWELNYENNKNNEKKHGCIWWALIILFFPISLPILFITTNKIKLNKFIRIIFVIALYVILIKSVNKAMSTEPSPVVSQDIVVTSTYVIDPTLSHNNEEIEIISPTTNSELITDQETNENLLLTAAPNPQNTDSESTEVTTDNNFEANNKTNEITPIIIATSTENPIDTDDENRIINNPNDVGTLLRTTPSTSGDIMMALENGSPVKLLYQERIADGYVWTNIQTDSGLVGWIIRDHVENK